jgi:hypothetical protein
MPVISTMLQFLIGLALGAVSAIAPGLLRPFAITALVLGALQATLLYQTGGAGAVEVAFNYLLAALRDMSMILIGLGLGRVAATVVFGSR